VAISGSAYRRPGARFLIASDGSTSGGISGGCLEEDVRQAGLKAVDDGDCRLLHYETGTDEDSLWGLGLGCDGEVDVFVAPSSRAGLHQAFARARELFAGDAPFSLITIIGDDRTGGATLEGRLFVDRPDTGDAALDRALAAAAESALAAARSRIIDVDGVQAFVERFSPPPQVVVCGAGDDAMPMVASAASAGFRVVVVDHRPAYLTAQRFPAARRLVQMLPDDDGPGIPADTDTFVVLKTHNLERDKGWARRFIATPVPYIGLLGPRARCDEITEDVCGSVSDGASGSNAGPGSDAEGGSDSYRDRIFGPVGLDLGAEGPEQVGMAVVSELLAVRSGREPGHLRNRKAPIHEPEP
jgi:xanthine dehydrogenase accessory factor